jgi:hypothetical protein
VPGFEQEFALADAIGFQAARLHSSRVSTFLPLHTVNCVQTLKADPWWNDVSPDWKNIQAPAVHGALFSIGFALEDIIGSRCLLEYSACSQPAGLHAGLRCNRFADRMSACALSHQYHHNLCHTTEDSGPDGTIFSWTVPSRSVPTSCPYPPPLPPSTPPSGQTSDPPRAPLTPSLPPRRRRRSFLSTKCTIKLATTASRLLTLFQSHTHAHARVPLETTGIQWIQHARGGVEGQVVAGC